MPAAAGSPQQLHMVRPTLDGLPELRLPEGYGLRTYQQGDEARWAAIMDHSIGQDWTAERCRETLTSRPSFRPSGFFMATCGEEAVTTACAWIRDGHELGDATVHMVGSLPGHRGKGLGRLVSLAVLRWCAAQGYPRIWLSTDDWRLPAIAIYLDLGFAPVRFDAEHERRWRSVREELAKHAPAR